MATARERKREKRRKQRAAERKRTRANLRSEQRAAGLFTGIGERLTRRQGARQTRRQTRIGERTTRMGQRQSGRSARTQSKAEGGFYDPESVAARWSAAADIAETAGEAYATSQEDPFSAMLAGITPADYDDGDGELVYDDGPADSPLPIFLVLGGVGLAAFLLLRPKKGKK